MKTTVTLCLDIDVALMLSKEKNKSALVNNYLRHYYSIEKTTDLEDAKTKAEDAKVIAAALDAKVDELTSIEPKREEVFL